MTSHFVVATLAAAMTIAVPASAIAASHHRHPVELRGYGVPTTSRWIDRPYLPYGYDPDPQLESALRKDRDSGMIDFPGIR